MLLHYRECFSSLNMGAPDSSETLVTMYQTTRRRKTGIFTAVAERTSNFKQYNFPIHTTFVWNGVHSASRGQLRSYLEEIVAAPVKKTETNDQEDPLR
jgi:hypothetical protein